MSKLRRLISLTRNRKQGKFIVNKVRATKSRGLKADRKLIPREFEYKEGINLYIMRISVWKQASRLQRALFTCINARRILCLHTLSFSCFLLLLLFNLLLFVKGEDWKIFTLRRTLYTNAERLPRGRRSLVVEYWHHENRDSVKPETLEDPNLEQRNTGTACLS